MPVPVPSTRRSRRPSIRLRPLRALAVAGVLLAGAGCGRSAPTDAFGDPDDDPEIAGVSVTSPGAVVDVDPTATTAGSTTSDTAPAATTGPEARHVVEPGETLSEIATRYGVSIQALADHNGIADVDDISPGQELAIPAPAATPVDDPAEQPPTGDAPSPGDPVEVEVEVAPAATTTSTQP